MGGKLFGYEAIPVLKMQIILHKRGTFWSFHRGDAPSISG